MLKVPKSAGVLMFRERDGLEVLLIHPGGPFWRKKDDGAWSIPKGEFTSAEEPLAAARREFEEELGAPVTGEFIPLGTIQQSGGKTVFAWAVRGEFDPATLKSNTFLVEWPPKSGRQKEFPEVDRAGWYAIPAARVKLLPAQTAFLDRLIEHIGGSA
jgi:predicted NUDIX family NTP pyrophosphohydrolase